MLVPVSPIVLCGTVKPLGDKGHASGISKRPVQGPWRVTWTGLHGDEQADLKNHGGPEKAVHHYPRDHYAFWRDEIGPHAVLDEPGAFGENFSTDGWTEDTVHVGDIICFGSMLLQVSQGRQPCWKLNARFSRDDIAFRTQFSGRTGWYYRVLEEGSAKPGDDLVLVERPCPAWPLSRLITLLYRERDRYDALQEMSEIPELANGWRALAARRVQSRKTENWTARLTEPQ